MDKKLDHNIFKTPHFIWGVFISFILSNILYFIIEPQDTFLFELSPLILFISLLTGFLLYVFLILIIRLVLSKIKEIKVLNNGITYYFLFTNLIVILTMSLLLWAESLIHDNLISEFYTNVNNSSFNIRSYFVVNVVVATIINSFYSMLYFFNRWNQEERISKELLIETHKLREISLQAELQVYKMQLDPHFLFNSFSVMTYLIDSDQEKAKLYLENLSNVYRYILTNSQKDTVTIATELELIEAYYELIKIRHQQNIILNIQVKESTKQLGIAPISLQLLLENAIKHNKNSKNNPLHISISDKTSGYLTIQNNIQKISFNQDSFGVGLENIKQRYTILSNRSPIFQENESTFTVKIPLLNP
jgi:sensor histidine kinase YesM